MVLREQNRVNPDRGQVPVRNTLAQLADRRSALPTDPSEVNDSAIIETAAITAAYLQGAAKVQHFSENRNKYGTYLYHGHRNS